LNLTTDGETIIVDAPIITSSIEEALQHGPYNIALFALKSFDTETALKNLLPYKDHMPPILCLQNGVENEELIAEYLGTEKVIHGTITSSVGKLGLGQIILERFRGVGISGDHPLSIKLEQAFSLAGLNPSLISPPAAMKWSKMLTNLVSNASSAILDMPPGEIFNSPGMFRIEIEQIREALRIMKALSIPVVDLPGTPVRAFVLAANRLPAWLSHPILTKAIGGGRGDKMPSFHIDLHSGREKSEVTYLNGAVSRYGEKLGIPTPVNDFLTNTLLKLVESQIPISTYQRDPEKFLKDFADSAA
jgi:2-dehydropantoate 2-reductase